MFTSVEKSRHFSHKLSQCKTEFSPAGASFLNAFLAMLYETLNANEWFTVAETLQTERHLQLYVALITNYTTFHNSKYDYCNHELLCHTYNK